MSAHVKTSADRAPAARAEGPLRLRLRRGAAFSFVDVERVERGGRPAALVAVRVGDRAWEVEDRLASHWMRIAAALGLEHEEAPSAAAPLRKAAGA